MRNTLSDLNNHLFMQLERLNDEDLKGEELQKEIERARAIGLVATQIVNNGRLTVEAFKTHQEYVGRDPEKMPKHLRTGFLLGE